MDGKPPRTKATREQNRRKNDRRRAARKGVDAVDIDPVAIYERDHWCCGLCHKAVDRTLKWPDPMSPSLDHLIPISLGGPHRPENVQLAHLRCNTAKGNRGGGEQLLLIG